jgi:hypothetical protein
VPPAREGVDDLAAVGSGGMITTVNVISVPSNHQKCLDGNYRPYDEAEVLWCEHRQKLAAEHAPMIEHQSPLQIETDGEMMVDTTVDVTHEPAPAGDGGVLKFPSRPQMSRTRRHRLRAIDASLAPARWFAAAESRGKLHVASQASRFPRSQWPTAARACSGAAAADLDKAPRAAAMGLRDSIWGSTVGRLHLHHTDAVQP